MGAIRELEPEENSGLGREICSFHPAGSEQPGRAQLFGVQEIEPEENSGHHVFVCFTVH